MARACFVLSVLLVATACGDDDQPRGDPDGGPTGGAATGGAASGGAGTGGISGGGGAGGVPSTGGVTGSGGATGTGGDLGVGGTTNEGSCQDLPETCGPDGNESCCTSLLVPGGTFYRNYDGVSERFLSQDFPATVSDFRLDKFEITVGRFRKFKAAWDAGWRPAEGAGKHTHLNGGAGLARASEAGHELGWHPEMAAFVQPTDTSLPCERSPTWTATIGAHETRPINCVTWCEVYAFCIWDGGFLPSETEWHYAASGGSEQRSFPWSNPPATWIDDSTLAVYCGDSCTSTQNVGLKPAGNGRYGHADLGGNVTEWTLDRYVQIYATPCTDCSELFLLPGNIVRGGSFGSEAGYMQSAFRRTSGTLRDSTVGGRCARSPQ